ncbi:antigen peptide transporter 2-like [Ctenopharyngodon idella]|uniref:antigen peptide transporter 2-like n=1 Tax=Ctenopharyngodon idella TaxID=7959 RepID=UPI00222FB4B6|nr:antigen peptide transporter 2-like [Ctenopharyngodon idella]
MMQVGLEQRKPLRTLFRLLSLSRPDVVPICGAFLFLVAAVISEMLMPSFTGQIIDALNSKFDSNTFASAIFFMGLTSFGGSFSAGCRGGLFMLTISRLTKRVRQRLFSCFVKQDIAFFETTSKGDITTCLSSDASLMSRSLAANVNILLRSLVMTIGIYCFMIQLCWPLALLSALESPITITAEKIYNKYYQGLVSSVKKSIVKSNQVAGESIYHIRAVRSHGAEMVEQKMYNGRLEETHHFKIHRDSVRATYLLFMRLFQLGMRVLILWYGHQMIKSGQMTPGNLVSFILYQMEIGGYVQTLVELHIDLIESLESADKVFEYMDHKPSVLCGDLAPDQLKGHVMFNNISFSYSTCPDQKALENVSFEMKPGSVTALVGVSGGGKSTCVALLKHLYEPQSGEILLDGRPLKDYDHKYFHQKVAVVSQEPELFSCSIHNNITYGLGSYSEDVLQTAVKQAHINSFVHSLKDGYDTEVGERGGLLSGGQKQRIAIARALIRQPQILILDEVTSSLDTESEKMIQNALACFTTQTRLIVAHRLKTIESADQIIVIDKGSVSEKGTHMELMKKKGIYYKLRESRFNEDNTETTC